MDLEIIILNEVARQRKQYHITYLWGGKITNELLYKTKINIQP